MPRHLALVPAFPAPVALLPPLPMRPADVLGLYYQHTNTPAKRPRAPRRRIFHPFQIPLPLPRWDRSKPKSIGAKPVCRPDTKGLNKKQRKRALALAERREEALRVRLEVLRPKTRADCKDAVRPCPFVSCRSNLFLEVKGKNIKLNFPGLEVHEMADSCIEDVIDKYPDGITLERVGRKLNLTMERVRQVEEKALEKVEDAGELYGFRSTDGEDIARKLSLVPDELDDEEILWLREILWEGCSCERHGPDVAPCSVVKALRALGMET